MQPVNEGICWQCGAPADPDCAYTQDLNAWDTQKATATLVLVREVYGQDYPVKRAMRQASVRVLVPRCAACRNRHSSGSLVIVGGAVGALAAQMVPSLLFPGLSTIVGAVLGAAPVVLARSYYYHGQSGVRSIAEYPPLLALRNGGWDYPN